MPTQLPVDIRAICAIPGPPPFVCTCRQGRAGAAWVHLGGELDLATVPVFLRTLEDAWDLAHLFVVDLRGLIFIDVSGVHALLDVADSARAQDRRVIAVRGHTQFDRMFTLARVADWLEIVELDPAEPPVQALLHAAPITITASRPRQRRPGRRAGIGTVARAPAHPAADP